MIFFFLSKWKIKVIINKILLAGGMFKMNCKSKSLKINHTRPFFQVTWLMTCIKIHPEEQSPTKYYLQMHLQSIFKSIMDIKVSLDQWPKNFFHKKSKDTTTYTRTRIVSEDPPLCNESHRPITKKFRTCTNYYKYKYNIWGSDLAEK